MIPPFVGLVCMGEQSGGYYNAYMAIKGILYSSLGYKNKIDIKKQRWTPARAMTAIT